MTTRKEKKAVYLEVLHEGPHCIPCEYMESTVRYVAELYGGELEWETVVTKERKGALRYLELSRELGRMPPVPSIFINGKLVVDYNPGPDELKDHIDRLLETPNGD